MEQQYEQIVGNSIGNRVIILEDRTDSFLLKSVVSGLEFVTTAKSFNQHYKIVEEDKDGTD